MMQRESEVFIVNNLRRATGLAIAVFAIFTIALAGAPATALAAGPPGGAVHGGFRGGPGGHEHPGPRGHPGFHSPGFRHPGVVHHGFRFGPAFPYPYFYYPYGYAAPAYWYYCPSYRAYYPSVATCPEPWVPVPSS
jgi:hypothetical protein